MRYRARGRSSGRKVGMNKLEEDYAKELELQKLAKQIVEFKFESIKLRLANNTTYTPDFYCLLSDLTIEFREVKGFWEDDARVKIKVAAEHYPHFQFVAIRRLAKKLGGGWEEERF